MITSAFGSPWLPAFIALWCLIGFVAGIIYAVRYFRHCAFVAVPLVDSHHELQEHESGPLHSLRGCAECRNWHRTVVYGQCSVARTLLAILWLTLGGPLSLTVMSQYRIELTKEEKESIERINAAG